MRGDTSYDVICVGTGLATSFFLAEYLRHAPSNARVLVLERGPDMSPAERIAERMDVNLESFQSTYKYRTPEKPWLFTPCGAKSQLARSASNFSGLEAGIVLGLGHRDRRTVVSMNSLRLKFLILIFAGWVNRSQQDVIEYLLEENRVLREQCD